MVMEPFILIAGPPYPEFNVVVSVLVLIPYFPANQKQANMQAWHDMSLPWSDDTASETSSLLGVSKE